MINGLNDEPDFEGFEEEIDSVVNSAQPSSSAAANVDDGEESDFEGFEPEVVQSSSNNIIADGNASSSLKTGGNVDGLIADIFGESDDEEFEGFAENEIEPSGVAELSSDNESDHDESKTSTAGNVVATGSSSEDELPSENQISDFDAMMERRRSEMRRRRRRKHDGESLNDSDDLIAEVIGQMKVAAEEDQWLVKSGKPGTKKLMLLPVVVSVLQKADLQNALLDCGILSAITFWLAPLPDKSLPALPVRNAMIKALMNLPPISADSLKQSGLGKAVMYLYKHPKERRENKEHLGRLINDWSRPIFNLTSNYSNLSKEERQQRDFEHLQAKKRRLNDSSAADPSSKRSRDLNRSLEGEARPLKPGDVGWVNRARVPLPSVKDYVVRPKSSVELEARMGGSSSGESSRLKAAGGNVKKPLSRFEKHLKDFTVKKSRNKRFVRAVDMSIEGRKMAL